jgi:PAS domain S-box-containing protein
MLQRQYEELVANIDGIVWEVDARTLQFTFVSQQAERLLGYPLARWFEPGFWVNHLHPDDRDGALEFCQRARRERRNHDFEYRMLAADGRTVWLRDIVNVVVEGDEPTRLRGVMVDVTDRKRAEEALRESEELYRLLTENANDLITLVDVEGRRVYFSPSYSRLLGRVPPATLDFENVHPEDLEIIRRAWGEVLAGATRSITVRYRHADGSWRWLDGWGALVRYRGKPHYLGIYRDITESKRAEEERQAHLWFLESMDRVNRAVQGTSDLGQMMSDVLDAVLAIFACDRAWLLYPCDPEAASWWVPMERTRPQYPGAFALGLEAPVDPDVAGVFRMVRASGGPVKFGPGSEHPLPAEPAKRFSIQSMIAMTVYPKVDKPYMFGLHQCSRPRAWTPQEERLFQEVGRRLADALTSLLAHRALRESEGKLEEAQRIAHVGYWDRDLDAGRITWSAETRRIFGLPTQEHTLSLARVLELIHPDDRQVIAEAAAAGLGGGPRYDVEYRVVRPGGEVRFVHSQGDVVRDESGRPRRMFGTVQDVTEQRRAADRLRASEARFRTLVEHATDAFFLHDNQGTILDVNRQACESLGYSREELVGMRPADFEADADRAALEQIAARLDAGEVVTLDSHHRRKDGTVFPVEVRIRPFWEGGRRFSVALARDITDRKRAERALVESHSLLNAVVEGTADAVFVKDLHGRYLMINSAGARFIGKSVEEVLGKDDQQLFTPDTAHAIMELDRRVMASGQSRTAEETATAAGVTRTYLTTKGVYRDAQGKVIGLIGTAHDVTEEKRLEDQLRQAQKMEAVGRLAGGVAHDFNNLLTVINGYSEMLFNRLPADDPGRELLAQVRKSGERAARLTRQLLAFSRKQVLQPQVVSLNTLLGELRKLLRPLIGEDIELALVPAPLLGLARVDPGQFEQAVINLAVNARDAMPRGGRLTIETHNTELDEDYAGRHPEVRPGRYVLVAVSDTGQGMDETTRARIFEPFFTTKGPGKGTGLGLAMVYGFVKQSGGHVEVYSEWGRGTTFKVYLPRAEQTTPSAKAPPDLLKVPGGTETVLLVEDEDAVRTLSRLVLQSSGYTVLEARDGQEAVWVAQQHQGPIHILVTDLVMPRMSGRQLADLLTQARPHVRTLFMSGYTDEAVLRHGVLEASVAFLQKPFSPIGLARRVREVLDAGEDRRS